MNFDQYELVSFPFAKSREIDREKNTDTTLDDNILSYSMLIESIENRFNKYSSDKTIKSIFNIFYNLDLTYNFAPLSPAFVKECNDRIDSILNNSTYYIDPQSISVFQIAALLAENSLAPVPEFRTEHFSLPIAVEVEIASYMSWKALEDLEKENIAATKSALSRFETEKQEALSRLFSELNEAQRRLLDMEKADIETRERLNTTSKEWDEKEENSRSVNEELQKRSALVALNISDMTDNWDSFKSSITEKVLGSETKKLWQDRSKENLMAFVGSAVILGVFLILFPILSFYKLDFILETLKHIGDAATEGIPQSATAAQLTVATISRLVVITFPLVLYVWVIRLIVRFNSRSLLLHDDARQRQTMMDTYFLLIERQAATPEERGLILNALFRPAPGHGSDNVDPPNFTDFIGKFDKP